MSNLSLSVVVCTHNPRYDYLSRAIEALVKQTLDASRWELIIVDNASTEAVSSQHDLSWHPKAHFAFESRLGHIFARVAGIQHSTAPAIVFVDDDNVVQDHYLERAVAILTEWPRLGALCGSLQGEFEAKPRWIARWQSLIAVDPINGDCWSNNPDDHRAYPCGAGLVVRRDVASRWAELVRQDEARRNLSRMGSGLAGGEDTDLILTGLSMGYGMGRFKDLELTHLIPARRVEPAYLIAIAAGHAWSDMWVRYVWKRNFPSSGIVRRMMSLARAVSGGWLAFRIELARQMATERARCAIQRVSAECRLFESGGAEQRSDDAEGSASIIG